MECSSENDPGGTPSGIKIEIGRAPIKRQQRGKSSIFCNDQNEDSNKTDQGILIGSIVEGKIEYVEPPKNEGPPVIELIDVNRWAIEYPQEDSLRPESSKLESSKSNIAPVDANDSELEVKSDSKYGLIIPPKRNKNQKPYDILPHVPMLKKNAIPGIEMIKDPTEKYLHDLKHRPDNVSEEDYENIPVSDFGNAMLRGMGWEEGKPIGRSSLSPVKIYEPSLRPSLLGLGAKPLPPGLSKKLNGSVVPHAVRTPVKKN